MAMLDHPNSLRNIIVAAVITLLISSAHGQVEEQRCQNPVADCDDSTSYFPEDEQIQIEYANATITSVSYKNTYVDITVAWPPEQSRNYRVVVCGCRRPKDTPKGVVTLYTKPISLYVQDSPAIHLISELTPGVEVIKYVNDITFVYNVVLRERFSKDSSAVISAKDIYEELNKDSNLSAVFGSTPYGGLGNTTEEDDITRPVLIFAEQREETPLGRAEWIKIAGLILDKSAKANDVFNSVVKNYTTAKKEAAQAVRRPAVFFNYPWVPDGDVTGLNKRYIWTQPGGKQYIAKYLEDANADYRFSNVDTEERPADSGIDLNFSETVEKFRSARVLLNSVVFGKNRTMKTFLKGLDDPEAEDELVKLEAVRCGDVWSNGLRVSDDGLASDWFESGAVRPDIVLLDYIKILHPNANLGDHDLHYMAKYTQADETGLTCPHTDIIGIPSDGEVFVDKEIVITGVNRFEVRDKIEPEIHPELKKVNIDLQRVDIHFKKPEDGEEDDTTVVVRTVVPREDARRVGRSSNASDAFEAVFPGKVKQTKVAYETGGAGLPPPTLSGGAIAGIVIACAVGVAVVIFLISRSSKRYSSVAPNTEFPDANVESSMS